MKHSPPRRRSASVLAAYYAEPLERRVLLSTATTNRVVAYFPDYRFGVFNSIDWNAFTHVNYFAVTANSSGGLGATSSSGYSFSQLDSVVTAAHAKGRTVSIVIDPGSAFMSIAQNSGILNTFKNNILAFCTAHSLDGIDLDWEPQGPPQSDINAYGTMITTLHNAAPGLLLSTASNPITHTVPLSAVGSLDWISVMGYDFDYANHSTYTASINGLNGWNTYGVPKSKLLLGMPYYGRAGTSWGNTVPETYNDIVNRYTAIYGSAPSASTDSAVLNFPTAFGGANMTWYWNGPTTIQNKTQYVLDNGYAGVMTWEIGQDHFTTGQYDQYSLLPKFKSMVMVAPFAALDASNNLVATGDNNANALALSLRGADVIVTLGGHTMTYPLASVNSIVINGMGGDDTLAINGPINKSITFNGGTGNDTLNVNAGTFTFGSDAQAGSDNLTINVASGAGVVFNASQHLAALNLNGGNATLSSNGNRILVAGALAISGGGKLDLADNALIVDYGGASPLPTVQSYINSGRNGGAWNGSGINSSAAAANSGRAVGFGEASSLFSSFPASFLGENIDSTSILARYTVAGDADLSGSIDTIDFNLVAANFSGTGRTFTQGDFNFDSSVDTIDFNLLASNFGSSLPAPAAAARPGLFGGARIASLADDLV